jgi:general secretion pathway protein K
MALLAVLWTVAALSIIATGITRSIRSESRAVVQARQEVEAQALGEGGIQIALQALFASNQPVSKVILTEVVYRGVAMQVQIMPLSGLVDINMATPPLLERLLVVAGGLPPDAAQTAAQSIVQARLERNSRVGGGSFEAPEDLLQVPGIDYDLYARLADLLTADVRGSGRINPMAAPVGVLTVLAGGDAAMAAQIAAARDAGQVGVDTSALDSSLLDASVSRRVKVQARVPMADGGYFLISRSVALDVRSPDGAPWHTFRATVGTEPLARKNP